MAAAYDFKLTLIYLGFLFGAFAAYQHFGTAPPATEGTQKASILGG